MMSLQSYCVVLFKSVSHAMRAEKILKNEKIPFKIIPVPKSISSDCGVCIRFTPEYKEDIEAVLNGVVEYSEIRELY
ncbi:MAG TPA: DUF3343 domain-containing protein [Spirochaetota bacterium]|nr:DUF3343 domain-containing protein [Spirochaetota bacterium]